jgi:hypothetical protein
MAEIGQAARQYDDFRHKLFCSSTFVLAFIHNFIIYCTLLGNAGILDKVRQSCDQPLMLMFLNFVIFVSPSSEDLCDQIAHTSWRKLRRVAFTSHFQRQMAVRFQKICDCGPIAKPSALVSGLTE